MDTTTYTQEWASFKNEIKNTIEHFGGKVGIHTDECTAHRKTHENCSGCTYERDCCKFVKIQLVALQSNPKFDIIDKLIAANTVDEVKAINVDELWRSIDHSIIEFNRA